MNYTINEVSKKYNISTYTLRYYDKEGLLPFVKRNEKGNRVFEDKDFEWLNIICTLRNSNMSISEIKKYVDLCMGGIDTISEREVILKKHKEYIEAEIENFKDYLNTINYKLEYYHEQQKNGTICKL